MQCYMSIILDKTGGKKQHNWAQEKKNWKNITLKIHKYTKIQKLCLE